MQGRIKDFFGRDRKTLYMILSIVLISIFSLTIVYAALSVTLNIQGNAEVVASKWAIHLDNVKVTSGSVSGNTPSITSPTTATFSTVLNMPGDFYEFTIDVVNDGSIDAMIDSVTKTPTLTSTQTKYLNYIIEYQNGESISTKQLVSKESFVRLKVRVEFRKDVIASDLPTTSETLNLAFTVNYVQSDGNGTSTVDNNGKLVKVVSGDYDTAGSEICIGEECFYVISSEEDTVTMLAKYNLHVGYSSVNMLDVTELENPTGKQNIKAIGFFNGVNSDNPAIGTVAFSTTEYWMDENYNLLSKYGTSYPGYVYDSNTQIYTYVENYKTYLSTLGVTPSEARLISYDELTALGCSASSCTGGPSWVYATDYWTGSAKYSSVYLVESSGSIIGSNCPVRFRHGVRPVIVIDKSLL